MASEFSFEISHFTDSNILIPLSVISYLTLFYILMTNTNAIITIHSEKITEKNDSEHNSKEGIEDSCPVPNFDHNSTTMKKYYYGKPMLVCKGFHWVMCFQTQCQVRDEILSTTRDVSCKYRDIIYENDYNYTFGDETIMEHDDIYILVASDHVQVTCTGVTANNSRISWRGVAAGLRPVMKNKQKKLVTLKNPINVMLLIFDSASRNSFINRLPRSYKFLTQDMQAVDFTRHNIVDDAASGALYPILTGHVDIELPHTSSSDELPLIFHHLKDHGYRTAYFEDSPIMGTVELRYNGIMNQPTDHYLRSFFQKAMSKKYTRENRYSYKLNGYCIGDIPRHLLLLNLTEQFLLLDGHKFVITYLDSGHDNNNLLAVMDDDLLLFLQNIVEQGFLENTLVIVMGDHGPRSSIRNTYQGFYEERMPLLTIALPDILKGRYEALEALHHNKNVLTTHFDIQPTIMDILGLNYLINPFMVPGTNIRRGLSLLQPINKSRSCVAADVRPHWCVCTKWSVVNLTDPMYIGTAVELANYINGITVDYRNQCAERRHIMSIEWVRRYIPKDGFWIGGTERRIYYISNSNQNPSMVYYQARIIMDKEGSPFEGTLLYDVRLQTFHTTLRDISMTNSLNHEAPCVTSKNLHILAFCLCIIRRHYYKKLPNK